MKAKNYNTIKIENDDFFTDLLNAAKEKDKDIYALSDISIQLGYEGTFLAKVKRNKTLRMPTVNLIYQTYGVDARQYTKKLETPNTEKRETPKSEDKTLEYIAEVLTEILEAIKDRNKNAYYFTPNESIFINECIKNADSVRRFLNDTDRESKEIY